MLTAAARRLRAPATGDRGSVAVFTAVFAVGVLLLVAVLVDGGNALNARERAADIAEQAARAAVGDLSVTSLRADPSEVVIDWNTACRYVGQVVTAYARDFNDVTSARVTGCQPGANPRTAMVSVQVTTKPVFPGFPAMTITSTQSATAACGNADQQEVC